MHCSVVHHYTSPLTQNYGHRDTVGIPELTVRHTLLMSLCDTVTGEPVQICKNVSGHQLIRHSQWKNMQADAKPGEEHHCSYLLDFQTAAQVCK